LSGIVSVLEEERRGVSYKMNNRYFEKIIAKIKEVWDQSPHGAVFLTKMKRVMRWYNNFCIKKAKEFKQKEEQLKTQLKDALN
jgi:hypothetical protein